MSTPELNSQVRSEPYPAQYVSSWTLRDGTQVTIRPIRPQDEPTMVKFHETLSDRTVYMRYFTSLSLSRRTAHERLIRICTVDYEHEMVLIAEHTDPHTGEQQIVAVARLNQLQSDRQQKEAEVAALVSDKYQHQGLGTELLRRLVQIARDKRISRLVAEMLWDNLAIQAIFNALGFELRVPADGGSVEAALDL
jgi:acetyltransferase